MFVTANRSSQEIQRLCSGVLQKLHLLSTESIRDIGNASGVLLFYFSAPPHMTPDKNEEEDYASISCLRHAANCPLAHGCSHEKRPGITREIG
jgi:hypothetical protein